MGKVINIKPHWASRLFDWLGRQLEKMEDQGRKDLEYQALNRFWEHCSSVYFGRPVPYEPAEEHLPFLKQLTVSVAEAFGTRLQLFTKVFSPEEDAQGRAPNLEAKAQADKILGQDSDVLAQDLWRAFGEHLEWKTSSVKTPVVAFHYKGSGSGVLGTACPFQFRVTMTLVNQTKASLTATLIHELCHLAIGCDHKHDEVFNGTLLAVANKFWGLSLRAERLQDVRHTTRMIEDRLRLRLRPQTHQVSTTSSSSCS